MRLNSFKAAPALLAGQYLGWAPEDEPVRVLCAGAQSVHVSQWEFGVLGDTSGFSTSIRPFSLSPPLLTIFSIANHCWRGVYRCRGIITSFQTGKALVEVGKGINGSIFANNWATINMARFQATCITLYPRHVIIDSETVIGSGMAEECFYLLHLMFLTKKKMRSNISKDYIASYTTSLF